MKNIFVVFVIVLLLSTPANGVRRRRRRRRAVNGGWGGWSSWGSCACNHAVGTGSWYRSRACNSPYPSNGGAYCPGSSSGSGSCDGHCCLTVHGTWNSWGAWGACSCSHTTGTGSKSRVRSCTSPPPSCGGGSCPGLHVNYGNCDDQCCQTIHGGWTDWNSWHCVCNHADGTGVRTKSRECKNPSPYCYGRECDGASSESGVRCDEECCVSVPGAWSSWGAFGECACNHVVGTGERIRDRTCSNPPPSCFGATCFGDSEGRIGCDDQCCMTVDGNWGEWSEWGDCSCNHGNGTGSQERMRTCNSPQPSCYGSNCTGMGREERSCDDDCCKTVHGGWTGWSDWYDCKCDHTIGHGFRIRDRECTDPTPACFGDLCRGAGVESKSCHDECCTTLHGRWLPWSDWSNCECFQEDGDTVWGQSIRERECTEPYCYGDTCIGEEGQTRNCTDACTQCEAGEFYNQTQGECTMCPIGTFGENAGVIECLECEREMTSDLGGLECFYDDPCYEEGREVENEGAVLYGVSFPSDCLDECIINGNCTRVVLTDTTCTLYNSTDAPTRVSENPSSLHISLDCLDGCEWEDDVYDGIQGLCVPCRSGMSCYPSPPAQPGGDDGDGDSGDGDGDGDGGENEKYGEDTPTPCKGGVTLPGIGCIHPGILGVIIGITVGVAVGAALWYRRTRVTPPAPQQDHHGDIPPAVIPAIPMSGVITNRLYGNRKQGGSDQDMLVSGGEEEEGQYEENLGRQEMKEDDETYYNSLEGEKAGELGAEERYVSKIKGVEEEEDIAGSNVYN